MKREIQELRERVQELEEKAKQDADRMKLLQDENRVLKKECSSNNNSSAESITSGGSRIREHTYDAPSSSNGKHNLVGLSSPQPVKKSQKEKKRGKGGSLREKLGIPASPKMSKRKGLSEGGSDRSHDRLPSPRNV